MHGYRRCVMDVILVCDWAFYMNERPRGMDLDVGKPGEPLVRAHIT
jgi:hypothetical protein